MPDANQGEKVLCSSTGNSGRQAASEYKFTLTKINGSEGMPGFPKTLDVKTVKVTY